MTDRIWLVGSGGMAVEYAKALSSLGVAFEVIGRGLESAEQFFLKTGLKVQVGGLDAALHRLGPPDAAIVAVPILTLAEATETLIRSGVATILVEKPLALTTSRAEAIAGLAADIGTDVRVAYNRRFYQSVTRLRTLGEEDGGIKSLSFDFTERAKQVRADPRHPSSVKERWVIANSSHVLDLVTFLAGEPKMMSTFAGESLDWHSSAGFFCGAGETVNRIPFSYLSDWRAGGRWGIEVRTTNFRGVLRPLEKLIVLDAESSQEVDQAIDYSVDLSFKPGLVRMLSEFFFNDRSNLPTVGQTARLLSLCSQIAGYS